MNPRVLMVDDEESLVWSLGRQFQHELPAWSFEGFSDPFVALERIRAAPPDVLVTDIRMPKMSGTELLVAARAVSPTLPAIVVTAYGTSEVLAAVQIRSNVEFLEKPVQFATLIERIRRLLTKGGGFSGPISLPLLPDLLQIYTLSMANGALTVRKGADLGTVWFERGEIVDAICGDQRGADAVYALLTWEGGSFSLDQHSVSNERTIHQNWQGLLLEGCRRLDESRQSVSALEETVAHWIEAAGPPPAMVAANLLLAGIQAEMPGFIGAALVNPATGRTLGALSSRDDFNPDAAAFLDGGAALQGIRALAGAGAESQLEDVLFTLSDQLHFLRRTKTGELIYVATERAASTNLALVRTIVSRQLGGSPPA